MENPKPKIHTSFSLSAEELEGRRSLELDNELSDEIDELELFDIIRHLNDPEYPLTLEQLNVVNVDRCSVKQTNNGNTITIYYTPTIPHCSMAQIIGLMIRVKVQTFLPKGVKVWVGITEGTHVNEVDINKQINDKERVAAAIENVNIQRILERGFRGSERMDVVNMLELIDRK